MSYNVDQIRGDIFGGVTAAVVALPLALAFGVASGAGPIAGLYGAIIVGFFAAVLGGTPTQISGPTGPMVVVFAGVFAAFSDQLELVFASVVLAGIFMVLAGIFKLGTYIRLVPYPVISGFMSGIGCIIIILQFGQLMGQESSSSPLMALGNIPDAISNPNLSALIISAISLAVVFLWPAKLGRFLPGPLAALLIATPVAMLLPGVPILGSIPTGLPSLQIPMLTADSVFFIVEAALILAALGAIDSLLTSLVADNMTRGRHDSNRELIGQGVGNSIAGLFGAIPGAGATMRTVINIRSGGTTRLSGALHSVVLLAIVLGLGPLAEAIPNAALAGILVKVGYDIIDWSYIKRAHRGPRWDLLLMVMVLGLTVFVDLITAVAAGVVLSALAFIQQLAKTQLASIGDISLRDMDESEAALLKDTENRIRIFDFGGPLSFGAAADMGHRARERTAGEVSVLILDFSRVPFIDMSAATAVETILSDAKNSGVTVYMTGMRDSITDLFKGLGTFTQIPMSQVKANRKEALTEAVALIEEEKRLA
ncbi:MULTISPECIES: SulP family inorganic anion transporter [unclassified Iodidimonas]|jgi:SulP family sulfate permease|uniref:SulP family inorganic anion transporter n=1 Tax=unclassified Iodidimonas TaxID=2626145 RepID=UPI002482E3F1|nr:MULTISPECIES: SulP family inorganic anion transporter [unclassified Iodidimonas]